MKMNDDIIKADSYDFDHRIEHGIVLALFYDELDTHCRALIPILEEVADTYYKYARIIAVEVEQSPDIAEIFAVNTLPTVLLFKDGRLYGRIENMNPPTAYENAIEDLISIGN